jgi:hypothetical protein
MEPSDDSTETTEEEGANSASESYSEEKEEQESCEESEEWKFDLPNEEERQLEWLAALSRRWEKKTGRTLSSDLPKVRPQ